MHTNRWEKKKIIIYFAFTALPCSQRETPMYTYANHMLKTQVIFDLDS